KAEGPVVFLVGTRPDIIKMSPLIKAIEDSIVVHTGQHYSPWLDQEVADDVGVKINHRVEVDPEANTASMLRAVMTGVKKILNGSPGCFVVYGDTSSAMAGALAAKNAGWK